tara:strand:+ start:3888 stop:4688 length:801 start_codon:yes stop_codon:yes gene_type:complete
MKKALLLFIFCISFSVVSQEIKREIIKGKIIVEGSDIEGITIFNTSSKKGSVTNLNGEFAIAVALNDFLEIRALEYQDFDVKINEDIWQSKRITIFLIEEINKLEEVVINSKRLTGNLKLDVNSAKKFNQKLNVVYFGMKSKESNNFSDDNIRQKKSLGVNQQVLTMVNGLNVVNVVDQLLIPLFRSEVKDKKAAGIPEVPVKSIKYYLGSNFLVENFNIPEHRVEEFIRYVEDETFDFDLLNYGHEIEFLELLSQKSKTFLSQKK